MPGACSAFVASVACACALALACPPAQAQLASCAPIADASARLACYDELARAERQRTPESPALSVAPPSAAPADPSPATAMENRWELRPALKRGIFKLVPHRPLYGLVHWTTELNERPNSPTRAFDVAQPVELDRGEGKIQLSFKTKLAEGLLGAPGDLWFGYTQVSYWQVANRRYSSPFRETNYEPEATLVFPADMRVGALRVRVAGLTLNHQSNGRGGSLSRSWNRVIGELGADSGPWSFHVRPWARVFAPDGDRNANPNIEDYIGRGELAVSWRGRGHVVTATGRHSLRGGERSRGSLNLDWAVPIAGSLNAHVQVFSGYGLNLVDYNHRQTTFGVGVSFFD